jgi:Cu-Zn family superoxide dismutase
MALSFTLLPAPVYGGARASLKAEVKDATGKTLGTALFAEEEHHLLVFLDLKGLPIGEHAVHIHEGRTCVAPEFKSAGEHFNPESKQHGFMNPQGHHAGDFRETIVVGPAGTVHMQLVSADLSLTNPSKTVMGHSIVIHAQKDDQVTNPSGNSGARIACGVIPNVSGNLSDLPR